MSITTPRSTLANLCILLLIGSTAHAAEFEMFATTSDDFDNPLTLVTVDPDNGAQTIAGPVGGVPTSRSIDWSAQRGAFLAVDSFVDPGVIQEIDPNIGVASPIATIMEGGSPLPLRTVSVAQDGTLYAIAGDNVFVGYRLGTVDLVTETFTPLLSFPADGRFYAGMDLATDGLLYAVYQLGSDQFLALIDVDTLQVIDELPIGTFSVDDIDFAPDGLIYHTNFSFALFSIDPATGVQTNIGFGEVNSLNGLGSIPTAALGASVTGVNSSFGLCRNLTAPQTVITPLQQPLPTESWDCEALGLTVAPGDEVRLVARSIVPPSASTFRGTVTRVMDGATAQCANTTQMTQVIVPVVGGAWNCITGGLPVNAFDRVSVTITGSVE
jgi:hypothetical protein